MSLYVTGDIHGNFIRLRELIKKHHLNKDDVLAIVGDVGFNYCMDHRELKNKKMISDLGVTIFCVRGNHERNPELLYSYESKQWNEGKVFWESQYPNLIFADDGEIYNIFGKKIFVCGGAYSVDKYYRALQFYRVNPDLIPSSYFTALVNIVMGVDGVSKKDKESLDNFLDNVPADKLFGWFKEEQPSALVKEKCLTVLKDCPVDIILTHTAPIEYEPTEVFIKGLNQEYVDKNTEKFLSEFNKIATYKQWFAGHYHTDKKVNDKFSLLYRDVVEIV